MGLKIKRSNSWKTTNKISMYLLAPFILQSFKKVLTVDPQLWECTIVGPKMVHLSPRPTPPPPEIFFWKILNIIFINFLALSLCKILKNSSSGSRVMRMCNFWTQNCPFPRMRTFSENLLMSLVSAIHAYLHAKKQSQRLIC